MSILGSSWHVAETVITSAYRALSKELITAELGAYVGLGHINITLCGKERIVHFFFYTFHVADTANALIMAVYHWYHIRIQWYKLYDIYP